MISYIFFKVAIHRSNTLPIQVLLDILNRDILHNNLAIQVLRHRDIPMDNRDTLGVIQVILERLNLVSHPNLVSYPNQLDLMVATILYNNKVKQSHFHIELVCRHFLFCKFEGNSFA